MKSVAQPALFYLAASQCLGSVGQLVMATISALVGAQLAPAPELATLPVALGIVGIATAAIPTARFSGLFGRRPVFIGAALWGAAGSALAGYAIHIESFALFCLSLLLTAYSAGLAIPFLVASLALDQFLHAFQRFRRWIPVIEKASGVMLIGLGVLLLTGQLTALTAILARFTPEFIYNRI